MRRRSRIMVGVVCSLALAAMVVVFAPSAEAMCVYDPESPGTCGSLGSSPGQIVTMKDSSTFRGWAYVRGLGICPAGATCIWAGELQVPAWRWTGSSWAPATRPTGTRVYAWPWTADWAWTWTRSTGWYAMRTDRIVIPTNSCWDYGSWQTLCMYAMAEARL